MSKINKTPIETRLAIERRSAAMLPDRPTQAGFKPWDIRRALFTAIIADKGACLMGEIDRIVDETNAVIDAMRIKSGTLTVKPAYWSGETTPRAAYAMGGLYTAGCAVIFMPEDDETKEQAGLARLSMAINETMDGEWSDVVVFVGEGGKIPSVDLHFRYIVIPTESEADAIVALVGVDAYGEGGAASGVDEEAVKTLIYKEVPEWARAKQKPTYTPEEIKARPATWMPTAKEIGARPSTWMPTAAEVGARPNTWTPTAGEVGAESVGKVKDHNEDSSSHADIRLDITTIRNMLAGVIGTDTGKSMRAVAALVVAEIVGDASDSFDTLEEIAAWIEAHPNNVAAMVKMITDLETAMGGTVNKTDIINTLDSAALDKPLSAAMGAKLNAMLTEISDELDGKTTPEQVAKAISDALTGYALKDHNHDGTYAKPADIPTKISQLAGDSTHRTVTDEEKTGWNGKADGSHNHDGAYQPKGNYQPAGNYLTQHQPLDHLLPINQGAENAGKILVVGEDGKITLIDMPATGDIIGSVDGSTILLDGDLAPGTYTFAYLVRKSDGTTETVTIGTYTVEEETETKTYTIEWRNYDGTVLETDEKVPERETPEYNGATPTKPDDDQYTYTFDEWSPTVVAATADATYTATYTQTAKPTEPTQPRNFANPAGSDWVNGTRLTTDINQTKALTGGASTNYIDIQSGDTVTCSGINFEDGNNRIAADGSTGGIAKATDIASAWVSNGYVRDVTYDSNSVTLTVTEKADWTKIRFSGLLTGTATDVVINIKRNGAWLTA